MISLIFFFVAAFFNACMDAFENTPNFNESIFKNLNKKFWCKDVSWEYAKKVFAYKLDSWHLSKSAMILCIVAAIIAFDLPVKKWQDVAIYVLTYGFVWNATFWLFYHIIFKVK